MHLRKYSLRLTLVLAVCIVASCKAPAQVDLSNWPQVHINAIAIEKSGHPSPELKSGSFDVAEDGHQTAVQSVTLSTGPQSVCVLVDTSSSSAASLPIVKTSVLRLLQQLPAQDEVCLATFSVKPVLLQKLSPARDQLPSLVASMQAGGGTALYDSLAIISDAMVKYARNQDRTIILFSDGDDNDSSTNEEALIKQLKNAGGPAVHLIRVPTMKKHFEASIPSYVQALGGVALFPDAPSDLARSVDQMLAALKGRYSIAFVSPEPKKNGHIRHLKIAIEGADSISVHSPEGYYAPSH